jgi:large subunit ribosomal protein L22
MSPYKVRPVLDAIRDKSYEEAAALLDAIPRSAAPVVKKVLESAAANAEHNLRLSRGDLKVAVCFCDGGPTLKRMMPRARGSANRILKRTSHITIVLDTVS